jgi:outer membrane protein assembly factor BamB
MAVRLAAAFVTLAASGIILANDWNQWRGPGRQGVVSPGPALAGVWPKDGPKKIWESPKIPSGNEGGFSSLSISGNCGYFYVNWKTQEPFSTRTISEDSLRQIGWFPEKLPDNLIKAAEETRLGEERQSLQPKEVKAWVEKWVADHLDGDQKKKFGNIITPRLTKGRSAVALDLLDKLASAKGREFPDQAALEKWLDDQAIPADLKKRVVEVIPTTRPVSKDVIVCLDLADGHIVWKKEYPGQASAWGSSSTPCLVNDRCYVAGAKTVYCLNAADGQEVWKVPAQGNEISSSPAVVEGTVVLLAGTLVGLDAADGHELWNQKKMSGTNASPALWTRSGTTWLICNTSAGLACLEPKTGRILWTVPGGGNGTATVDGDTAVLFGSKKEVGLVAYRMTLDKAEKLWSVPVSDRGTTPVIYQGHVYATGGNEVFCVSIEGGQVVWKEEKVNNEISSPLIADGKLLAVVDSGKTLLLIKASPEKYELLSKASRQSIAPVASPVVNDGRLYLRLNGSVACYDLRAGEPVK